MSDFYLYFIISLLPLTACMVVLQVNPYHALIIRGVLGAVAATVDAVLGAADVALTEALMGTMLAITLYAVAVRSSLVLRLGIIESEKILPLLEDLRQVCRRHYLRLELVPFTNIPALERALLEKEIHATCIDTALSGSATSPLLTNDGTPQDQPAYQTQTRIPRLYEIMKNELTSSLTALTYMDIQASFEANLASLHSLDSLIDHNDGVESVFSANMQNSGEE